MKMREWNILHQNTGVECVGVENAEVDRRGGKCKSKSRMENAGATGVVRHRESKSSHRTQNIDISYNYNLFVASAMQHTQKNAWLSKRCLQTFIRASLMRLTRFLARRMAIPRLALVLSCRIISKPPRGVSR